jgi:conjugative relaxase-like TrwC/TraI family protein
MLTSANVSSEMAVNYFVKNYYHQGKSRWSGQGAEKLGLSGEINNEDAFKNVIEGRSPDGHEQLNARVLKPKERRAALDCTFSAPKSVSLMALVGGDSRLVQAHHQALKEVIALIERRYACTRVTDDNGRHRENTGNLVVAQFDHIESRDLDPHLHTHCLVMNMTQTSNGRWMGLVNGEIFANKKFLGMTYQSCLAREVQKLGYEVEQRQHGQFEIKGFKEQDLEAFSKRRQQILATAGANSTWAERNQVWDTTRRRKEKISEDELKSLWLEEAAALGIRFVKPGEPRQDIPVNQLSLVDALDDAIAHCSERNVAFNQEDLEKFILEERLATDVTAIEPLIREHQELIALPGLEMQYTTWAAVERELATIELMQRGQEKVSPILHPEVVESQLQKTSLNTGQRQAVQLAALTQDQFVALSGVAGSGKTFALSQLKTLATDAGYTIKGFAPSSAAAKVLSEELEVQSETVARLLVSEPPTEVEPNQVWIVDEAGLLSAKDAYALLQRATIEQARVILVGDTRQLSAVEAGNPFKSLQQAGIKTAHLNESLRQKHPDLKLAVDLIADGRIEAGFQRLEANGSIVQLDSESKIEQIANDYIVGSTEQRAKTLVLAGTNTERLALTQAIRDKLKGEGTLGETATITQLQAKNLTIVQMRFAHNFELGDVVMPTRDYKRRGLEKGKLYEVVGRTTDKLTLIADNGQVMDVDTAFEKAVYQSHQIEIAVGDRLQWKKNDRQLERRNGQGFVVTAIAADQAEIKYLESDRTESISLSLAQNLDYALVSTTYSSQGKTADRVLISADFTIGQESFYVAASRARHELKIYTEEPTRLIELAQESKAKKNALELLRQQVREKKAQEQGISIHIDTDVPKPVLKTQATVSSAPPAVASPVLPKDLPAVAPPALKSRPLVESPTTKPIIQPKPSTNQNQNYDFNQQLKPQHTTSKQSNNGEYFGDSGEGRAARNQSLQTKYSNPVTRNQPGVTQREDSAIRSIPVRKPERVESQSLELFGAISRYVELQEILELRATLERINHSLASGWLRGQRTAQLPTSAHRQDSAIVNCSTSDVSVEQDGNERHRAAGKLLNAISGFLETTTIESTTIVKDLETLTENLQHHQNKDFLVVINKLGEAIATSVEQLPLSQATLNVVANFVDASAVESILAQTLPSITKQISQYHSYLANGKDAVDRLEQLLTNQREQNQTLEAIANHIERQSVEESEVVQVLEKLAQQLKQLPQIINATSENLKKLMPVALYQPQVAKPILKQEKPQTLILEKPKLKPQLTTEAFWSPTWSNPPDHIEPEHWKELVEGSAIHPDIAALNFKTLQIDVAEGQHEAWGRLLFSKKFDEKSERINTGVLIKKRLFTYDHLDHGGWWCSAGVDPRRFAQIEPGQKPDSKLWGCLKPNKPRVRTDPEQPEKPAKIIKYEHPPEVEGSIFLLDVPDEIAQRIYKKAGVEPSTSDRASGFWYCVWKHNVPITLTEGAKKAASLLSQGHATIGLPGITTGYRREKTVMEDGTIIKGEAHLHQELAPFSCKGRSIKFCFDYETKPETKQNIESAISTTGKLLEKVGVLVSVVDLPGPDKGADDFIVAQGGLAYEKLSDQAMRLPEWRRLSRDMKYLRSEEELPKQVSPQERQQRLEAKATMSPNAIAISEKFRKQLKLLSDEDLAKLDLYITDYFQEHENENDPQTQGLRIVRKVLREQQGETLGKLEKQEPEEDKEVLKIAEMIEKMTNEELGDLVLEVMSYFKKPHEENDPQFEQMKVIRTVMKSMKSKIIERVANYKSELDQPEQIQLRL